MSRKRISERLARAEELLATGVSPQLVAHRVSEQFGVGLRQGQIYVRRVFQAWSEIRVEERSDRKELMRRTTQALFEKCYFTGQLGPAVRALDLLARLDGLLMPTGGHGINDTRGGAKAMSPQERRNRIRELIIRGIRADPELAEAAREGLAGLPGSSSSVGSP